MPVPHFVGLGRRDWVWGALYGANGIILVPAILLHRLKEIGLSACCLRGSMINGRIDANKQTWQYQPSYKISFKKLHGLCESWASCSLLCSGMGCCCSTLSREQRRDVADSLEDQLHFPVQVSPGEHTGDFIDLRADKFSVECTEPSEPNTPRCVTLTVCVDTLLNEFYAPVYRS